MSMRVKSLGRWVLVAVGTVMAAGGCYDPKEVEAFLRQPRSPVSTVAYRCYPPDTLRFHSSYVPEIENKSQQIRPDGRINLPLVGEIEVAGRTPAEIEASIAEAASEYYEEVDVRVEVVGYNSQRYYVFGQVNSPGPRAWTGRDSLLDALAQSQPAFTAWPERIMLIRGDQPKEGGYADNTKSKKEQKKYRVKGVWPEEENRPRHVMTFNMYAMVKKGDMATNVLLLPNDIIYVRPHPLAEVGLGLQKLLLPVSPIVQTVSAPSQVVAGAAIP